MSNHIPEDRRYATSHEWAKEEGGLIKVGISDFAIRELGDLVFVDLPEVGSKISSGEPFGEIESVKAVSELISPVTGEIVDTNTDLEDSLETLVDSPYEDGWMIKIQARGSELDELQTAEEYTKQLEDSE